MHRQQINHTNQTDRCPCYFSYRQTLSDTLIPVIVMFPRVGLRLKRRRVDFAQPAANRLKTKIVVDLTSEPDDHDEHAHSALVGEAFQAQIQPLCQRFLKISFFCQRSKNFIIAVKNNEVTSGVCWFLMDSIIRENK